MKKDKKDKKNYVLPERDFIRHLEETSKIVEKWPDWKKNWLGNACPNLDKNK